MKTESLRDGVCDCHPWVIACIHIDGWCLNLRSYCHPAYEELYAYDPEPDEEPFRPFGVFGGPDGCVPGPYFDGGEHDTEEAAWAAFRKQEVVMLDYLRLAL